MGTADILREKIAISYPLKTDIDPSLSPSHVRLGMQSMFSAVQLMLPMRIHQKNWQQKCFKYDKQRVTKSNNQ